MPRKIIKVVLFILAAVIVAGGIMTYLRSQKNVQEQQGEVVEPTPSTSKISEVIVNPQDQGAQVQIKGVTSNGYKISRLESTDGIKVQVPNAPIEQIKRLFENPHPLIKKIEVRELPENPTVAEITFFTEKNVDFLDTQSGDTLKIDFVKSDVTEEVKTETVAQQNPVKEAPEKILENKNVSEKKVATKEVEIKQPVKQKLEEIKKSTTTTLNEVKEDVVSAMEKPKAVENIKKNSFAKTEVATPVKTPSKIVEPKLNKNKTLPVVNQDDFDLAELDSELSAKSNVGVKKPVTTTLQKVEPKKEAINSDNTSGLSSLGIANSVPPRETVSINRDEDLSLDSVAPKKFLKEDDDGFDLNELAKSEENSVKPVKPKESVSLLDAETSMSLKENAGAPDGQKIASLPNQKFDLNKIQANLPELKSLSVVRSGDNTLVTFDREKPIGYKVFRMVNPSRIVVDFKDAKNNLKSDYPRFAGTKISRVETREFAGPEGMLVRVILYVDGAPAYTSSKNGNQLQLELK